MNEITQQEQAAIYLERARANAEKLSCKWKAVIALIGSDHVIETEKCKYTLKKFNGKFYYIAFK